MTLMTVLGDFGPVCGKGVNEGGVKVSTVAGESTRHG